MKNDVKDARKRCLTGRDLDYLEKTSVGSASPYVSGNKRAESSYRSQLKRKLQEDLTPYYLEHLDDWNMIARAMAFDKDLGRGQKQYLKRQVEENIEPLSDFLKNWLSDEACAALLLKTLMEARKEYTDQEFFSPALVLPALSKYISSLSFKDLDPKLEDVRKNAASLVNELSNALPRGKLQIMGEPNEMFYDDPDLELGSLLFPTQNVIGSDLAWLLDPIGLKYLRKEKGATIELKSGGRSSVSWGFEINIPALILEALIYCSENREIGERGGNSIEGIITYLAEEIARSPLTILEPDHFSKGVGRPFLKELQNAIRKNPWEFSPYDAESLKRIISSDGNLPELTFETDYWWRAMRHVKGKIYENDNDLWEMKLTQEAEEALRTPPTRHLEGEVRAILYPFSTMNWLRGYLNNKVRTGGIVTDIKEALNEMDRRGLISIDNKRWWMNRPTIHITNAGLDLCVKKVEKNVLVINTYWEQEIIAGPDLELGQERMSM